MNPACLGAIEAGGTKFVCAIGTPEGKILQQRRISTSAPVETIRQVITFFRCQDQPLAAIGIGSFGPLNLNRDSQQYGFITSTPKVGWAYFDLLGAVRSVMDVPIAFDTDVNAAGLAEGRWGAARGLRTFMYVTVGTGIGGAAIINGSTLQGLSHPEMGHIRVPHDAIRDPFRGICPYHGDCLEGLASGTAIEARWKAPPSTLSQNHPSWELEAEYLALGCANWICTLLPEMLILGGGVMREALLSPLRKRVGELLNGYLDFPQLTQGIDRYLTTPALGSDAGILGALALAAQAVQEGRRFEAV